MGEPVSRLRGTKSSLLKMVSFLASQAANITGETLMNAIPGDVTTMTLKAPVGVIGGIIPWDGPPNRQFWVIGGGVARGGTPVLKPAEDAPLSVVRGGGVLHEARGPGGGF